MVYLVAGFILGMGLLGLAILAWSIFADDN
jgi:hypothetical protein